MEELVSVKEAGRRLGGISVWTIYAWISAGKLEKVKVGSRTMVAISELERFVRASNRIGGRDVKSVE